MYSIIEFPKSGGSSVARKGIISADYAAEVMADLNNREEFKDSCLSTFRIEAGAPVTGVTIREMLAQIPIDASPGARDFTVILSGKQSKRMSGVYHPESHEIVLHNKNFKTIDELMLAAIHEYAHHLDSLDGGRGHRASFKAIHARLMKGAREKGLINLEWRPITAQVSKLKTMLAEHAALERKIGAELLQLKEACIMAKTDPDEVISEELQITKKTAKRLVAVAQLELYDQVTPATADVQTVIVSVPPSKRKAAAEVVAAAPTVEAGQTAVKVSKARPPRDQDSPGELRKELRRIEKTISSLEDRKVHLEERLIAMDQPGENIVPFRKAGEA